jgi:hypothetical protein
VAASSLKVLRGTVKVSDRTPSRTRHDHWHRGQGLGRAAAAATAKQWTRNCLRAASEPVTPAVGTGSLKAFKLIWEFEGLAEP